MTTNDQKQEVNNKTDSEVNKNKNPGKQKTQPPSLKEMVGITLGLMSVCVASAFVLGLFYLWTEPIKAKNLEEREANTIRRLLELSAQGETEEVRRYMNEVKSEIYYVTSKGALAFSFEGQTAEKPEVPSEILSKIGEEKREALNHWMKTEKEAHFVGRFFIGRDNKAIAGYVVEGETLGYKNKIRFFVAMDSSFTIRGVEVAEQEEDPGLGGEIAQKYFKNQFAGRSAEMVENLLVIKDPLPQDWRKVLESLGALPYSKWSEQNKDKVKEHPQIYSITGSTISSDALTNGVKKTLNNFKLRLKLLEGVL